jgi:hypothetical protein
MITTVLALALLILKMRRERGGKAELLEALFIELLEKTGDRERRLLSDGGTRTALSSFRRRGQMRIEEDKGTFLSCFKHWRAGGMGLDEQRESEDATVREETSPDVTVSRL